MLDLGPEGMCAGSNGKQQFTQQNILIVSFHRCRLCCWIFLTFSVLFQFSSVSNFLLNSVQNVLSITTELNWILWWHKIVFYWLYYSLTWRVSASKGFGAWSSFAKSLWKFATSWWICHLCITIHNFPIILYPHNPFMLSKMLEITSLRK